MTEMAKQAAKVVKQHAPHITPKLGIVCGSGLGKLADAIIDPVVINYEDLPGFPICSVEGHGGQMVLGELNGMPVACLTGRAHYYEGTSHETIKTYIRTLKLIGCDTLLATNSSGSLRPEVGPGSLVVIHDHINHQFTNILVGPNDDEFGPRFVGMEDIYDPELRKLLAEAGKEQGIELTEGVYLAVIGPTFETPAEIRAFATLGGEVIGMSTVPEIISAKHCGLRIALVSVITNMAAGMSAEKLTHEGTLAGAKAAEKNIVLLVNEFIKKLAKTKTLV